MSIFLWFAVMVAMVSASKELLAFRRQLSTDDVMKVPKPETSSFSPPRTHLQSQTQPHVNSHNSTLTTAACNDITNQIQNKLIEKAACAVREVYLGLKPPTTFQSVNPETLWVKRCVGNCPFSETGFTCRPSKTVRRNLPITLYNAKTRKYYCSTFTLEEHESCICDDPGSTCTPEGVTLDVDPPRDKDTVHPGIHPGTLWIKQCVGTCSAYNYNCMPASIIQKEVVTPAGVYQAEEHDTCRCDSSLSPCAPKDAYIELPTNYESANPQLDFGLFLTKRCAGNCSYGSDGFKCMPLRTVMRNVYDTLWQVEEHLNCICAKGTGP